MLAGRSSPTPTGRRCSSPARTSRVGWRGRLVAAEALAGLAGVALFAAPGAGLAELLPAVRAFGTGRRLAYAWLLGVAWTAGLLYALSHFLAVPLRAPAILTVAAVPASAGAVSWLRRRPSGPLRRQRLRLWEGVILAVW